LAARGRGSVVGRSCQQKGDRNDAPDAAPIVGVSSVRYRPDGYDRRFRAIASPCEVVRLSLPRAFYWCIRTFGGFGFIRCVIRVDFLVEERAGIIMEINAFTVCLQRRFADSLGMSGKFVVNYSQSREFIFGDGFFHNFASVHVPHYPRMLVPLTPEMALLYARPTQYRVNPRMMTFTADASEAHALNQAVHVYARDNIFFRLEPQRLPTISGKPNISISQAGTTRFINLSKVFPVSRHRRADIPGMSRRLQSPLAI
jgi:hypothetical protein